MSVCASVERCEYTHSGRIMRETTGRGLPAAQLAPLVRNALQATAEAGHANEGKLMEQRLRSPRLDGLIARNLAQDIACFKK